MNKSVIVLLFICTCNYLQAGERDFPSKETFKNPPLTNFPKPLWFWNDTKVTEAGITSQMQGFRDSCHYGGFSILPFGAKFKPEYLTEEYFNVYGKALEKAAELGLTMCLYDEYGFPSGGAGPVNGDGIGRFEKRFPDQTIKRLDKTEFEISGPTNISRKIPEGKLMAVVAMEKKSFKRLNLADQIVNGELKWEIPEGNWKLMFFMCVKDGDPIVDYLDPLSVRNFIEMTHEAYYKHFKKYFGNVISGTFFDEPTMYRAKGRIWTNLFNEKFQKKNGFDPSVYYPALWYNIGPETAAARNYLFGFRTELYALGFTKEVNDWSIAHHINATGHQDQEEVLNPVSVSGDLMKCFKYLEIPGIDKIGGNRPAERYYKIVSSAAYNWDKSMIMSETYGAMGNIGWNEIFSVAMDQYAKGINMLIPHAVWYNDKNVMFKPELSQRNPLYADSLKTFNHFLARLNTVLQQEGRHVADIAILYPIHSLQGDHYLDGPLENYKGGVEIPKTDYVNIANWLTEDAGKDFTFIHPEVLDEKCTVSSGKLQIQNLLNKEEFRVLIIPSCKTISLSNLKKIKLFYDNGGHLIFTSQLPVGATTPGKEREIEALINSMLKGESPKSTNIKSVQTTGSAIFLPFPDGASIRNAIGNLQLKYDVDYPLTSDLRYIHRIIKGNDVYYFANVGKSPVETSVQIKGIHHPQVWDPHSGEVSQIHTTSKNGKDTGFILKLAPYHSVFMISTHGQ